MILERNPNGSFDCYTLPYQAYKWLPTDLSRIKEHIYSAVFPSRPRPMISLQSMQCIENQRNTRVLIVNDEVVAGRDRLELCIESGIPAHVLDITKADPVKLKQYVTRFNSHRRDLSDNIKRIAAQTLYWQSGGELTHQEAMRICGLPAMDYW